MPREVGSREGLITFKFSPYGELLNFIMNLPIGWVFNTGTIMKINLLAHSLQELTLLFEQIGEKKFRAKQLFQAIQTQGLKNIDDLSTFSKDLRQKLSELYTLDRPEVSINQQSRDSTQKWLLKLADGNEIEAVYIPEADRGTLCISSQIGCTLTCKFCHTGTQRLVRNLEPHEIMGQIMLARDAIDDWGLLNQERKITNIVLMGMGEPLFNYDNVAHALKVLMDPDGMQWSKRRITLSTSGVVPMIAKCGEELGVNLAISLHATTNELRNILVPLNKKYPLEELLDACAAYPGVGHMRRITFEYVMLKGVNDTPEHAKRLLYLVYGIPAKINLIPFNPWPNSPFERSSNNAIHAFAAILEEAGYSSPVRTPRGEDIMAACGQLKSESERPKRTLEAERKKAVVNLMDLFQEEA